MMFYEESGHKLLILDEFICHWTKDEQEKWKQLEMTLLSITPGYTDVSQPVDVFWNK